jgi:predicted dehydrogenase
MIQGQRWHNNIEERKRYEMHLTNWGIIGPGNIAKQFIADLPLAGKGQNVIAVSGRRIETVNSFADEYSIPGRFTSMDEFIHNGKPQVVYIATPHPLHYEEAAGCLQNNIPVLVEKPLCLNTEQGEELIALSRKQNTFLMEAMWIRFLPGILKMIEIIKEGVLGDIVTVYASMNYKAPYDQQSRYFNPALGGGSLLDLGVYTIFLAHLILGQPQSIQATAVKSEKGIDELCSAIFQYNAGAHAIIQSSLLKNSEEPAVITGTKGTMRVKHPWFEKSPGLEVHLDNNVKLEYPFSWEGHGLHFEITEVLDCIRSGVIESEKMPHDFSLSVIKTMDEIRRQCGVRYDQFE